MGVGLSASFLHCEKKEEVGRFGGVIVFFFGWLALLRNFWESFLCRELSEWVVRVPRTGVGGELHLSVRLVLLLLLIRGVDYISIRSTKKVRPMRRPNIRIRSSIMLLPKTMVHKIMVLMPRTLVSEGD